MRDVETKSFYQQGFVEVVLILVLAIILIGGGLYYVATTTNTPTKPTPPQPVIPTPTISTISYDELRMSQFVIPSEIPLHKNATVEAKYAGYDKEGHNVYRINTEHRGLTLEEIYSYYKLQLEQADWNIRTVDSKFCEENTVYFCPEWAKIIASTDSGVNLTIFYINSVGYLQWYKDDTSDTGISIQNPLDAKVLPNEFLPDLLLVQVETPGINILLEMYAPLTTKDLEHTKLLSSNGYTRCAYGSAAHITAYNCTTEDETRGYYIELVNADTYSYDVVAISYKQE